MSGQPPTATHRDRQILCGLFLSKFDQTGLQYLGFDSFTEAFNALGYGLRAKPASIKNYRDELDPHFSNPRKGWHKRRLRPHCQSILDGYKGFVLEDFGELVASFLLPPFPGESIPEVRRVLSLRNPEPITSFAKRLITGRAAEQYFMDHHAGMPEFAGLSLTDTTGWGCGFDFRMASPRDDRFSAVEVKGLREKTGQIQMTDLEFAMADALQERYFLVLVRNFAEDPFHSVIVNPAHSSMQFTRVERTEVRLSWNANVVA